MELDMRKMRILAAIVDDYITTAMPIGSRTISKHPEISLSSATIRNEMSDLEELGYLEQPHTSAGRIPSDKAYRLYVDTLMHGAKLSDVETHYMQEYFTRRSSEVADIVKQTAWVLSDMTKYTSVVLAPQLHRARLKHIQLVPVAEGKALCVVVTDAGVTHDATVSVPKDTGVEELERMSRLLTKTLANRRMDESVTAILPELTSEISAHAAFLQATLDSIQRGMQAENARIALSGATNMLSYPEYSDLDKARSFLSAMETTDKLYDMLAKAQKLEFSITIGSENEDDKMRDCSIITATYRVGNEPMGSLGIIGPTRMNYARTIAVLKYMCRGLSEMFTNMFEEER